MNENNEIIFSSLNYEHHKVEENVLNRQKIGKKLKRKALDDPCEKPCKILHREFRKGDVSTLTTTDINRIRTNIHYARSSIIPKLPINLEELHLALTNLGEIKTNKDEIFLLINNTEKKYCSIFNDNKLKIFK